MKKNAVVILLIILLSLCVLIGGVLLVILLDISGSSKDDEVTVNQNEDAAYEFSLNKSIVTNIKDSKKCVRCKVVLQLSDKKESEKLSKESYKVNDLIIEILRKTEEYKYREDDIQKILENEIKKELEKELGIKSIIKVYFSEFITQ